MFADAPPAQICVVEHEAPSIEAARAARLRGDYDHALRLLACVLIETPQSADVWIEFGFAESASGRDADARTAFLRALEIAPDYDDAKLGLALIAHRAGDDESARSWLQLMSPARANDPEVRALRRAVAPATPPVIWRWDGSGAYSSLSNDLAPWREVSFAVTRRSGPASIGMSAERLERFGVTDVFGEVRYSRQVGQGVWGLALGGASGAHFRPETALRFEYATSEDQAVAFDAALTLARYRVGQVDRLVVRAHRQVAEPLRVSATGILVRDEKRDLRSGYAIGAKWTVREGVDIDASWADAPESSEGFTIDVRATSFGLSANLRPDVRVRFGVTREERDAFDRSEFSLSVTRTF